MREAGFPSESDLQEESGLHQLISLRELMLMELKTVNTGNGVSNSNQRPMISYYSSKDQNRNG
jgi:hypothetical protein